MKTNRLLARCLLLLALATPNSQLSTTFAQGTAFTYQGRLNDGAGPATGLYDFRFAVFDDATAGGIQSTPVLVTLGVTNGLFTTTLNFGGNVFNGSARWLEINVRTNGAVDYATLAPRQPVTPAPYAIYAANAATLGGSVSADAVNSLSGGLIAETNRAQTAEITTTVALNAEEAARKSGDSDLWNSVWKLNGNSSTTAGSNFVGTLDYQPLEFKVNNTRALRLEPAANDSHHSNIVNVVGGSSVNFIAPGVYGSVIAGGGAVNYYGWAGSNSVFADQSFLGGGWNNSIQTSANYSFLGGGFANSIQTNATDSFLGGGGGNVIQNNTALCFLGGGMNNSIQTNTLCSFLGGGMNNSIQNDASTAFLGGGFNNSIQPNAYESFLGGGWLNTNSAPYSVVPGGDHNFAGGTNSFAVGHRAKANFPGDFVWADAQDADFNSTATNQFSVRAAGGAQFVTGGAGLTVDGSPVLISGNGLTIRQNADTGAPNLLGGSPVNFIANGVVGATLSGGGATNYWGSSYTNSISADFGTIGGGQDNTIQRIATASFIGGGQGNIAGNEWATVGGGMWNHAWGRYAMVGGGQGNTAGGEAATVGGGDNNGAGNNYATVGGGSQNAASGQASTVGGGRFNTASGYQATVGGGFENTASDYCVTVGGGYGNSIQTGAACSFLGGGTQNSIQMNAGDSVLGGGIANSIQTYASFSFLGGGYSNSIQPNASFSVLVGGVDDSIQSGTSASFLGGGVQNSIQSDANNSFLGGGEGNSIQMNAGDSVLGGGGGNSILTNADHSVLGGGQANTIQASAGASVLGGGYYNVIQANAYDSVLGGGMINTNGAPYSVVPGGNFNYAGGFNSFAAGHRAKANYAGDFVWADTQDADFNSTATNQFSMRAAGGVQFVTSGAGLTVDGAPVLTSGGGSGLTIQQNTEGAPNIIGGASVNFIADGVAGSVISGGGGTTSGWVVSNGVAADFSFLGGGYGNSIQPDAEASFLGGGEINSIQRGSYFSYLGGGWNNSIQTYVSASFLGGGEANCIQYYAQYAFLGGGMENRIETNASKSFLGGGEKNSIQPYAFHSFLGGGQSNSVLAWARYAVLCGGQFNTNGAVNSVVPGGDQNFAGGTNSFAAGHRAKANYAGDFVWADTQDADFNSTATNQFSVRAAGGVHFVTSGAGLTLDGQPVLTGNNAITVTAGTGLSGGGAVALGGSVTLNNSGVLSVGASGSLASSGGQNPQISLSGIVPIANGGLGFAPSVFSSGQYLRSSGVGSWSVNSIQAGDLPSLSATYVDLSSGQTIGGSKNFSGSVGIGVSPGFPLDVNGRMALRGSSSGVNAGLWLYDSAATGHTPRALLGMDGTGYFGVWGDLGANWGVVMNVTNGYVGIGTGTPDALLTVNGAADKPGGGSWSTYSDARLKNVGAKFTHGLADLARIQPVHYHYKTDNPLHLPSQPEYVGVVAQQVQPAIPEAVQPNKAGYLTVNNDPIIWTMVNAIKELNQNFADGSQNSETRMQKLETENAELKAQNAALSARLERIEQLLDKN